MIGTKRWIFTHFMAIFCLLRIEICSSAQCTSTSIDRNKLVPLSIYTNNLTGPYRDSFTTIWGATKPNAIELSNYKFNATLGRVSATPALSIDANRCDCLVKLIQMFDVQVGWGGSINQPGPFGRFDHKLVRQNIDEPNILFENYKPTGEEVFCVSSSGECGATVPLYKWFDIGAIDTFYSINQSSVSTSTSLRADGLLCYIWPVEIPDDGGEEEEEVGDGSGLTNTPK